MNDDKINLKHFKFQRQICFKKVKTKKNINL